MDYKTRMAWIPATGIVWAITLEFSFPGIARLELAYPDQSAQWGHWLIAMLGAGVLQGAALGIAWATWDIVTTDTDTDQDDLGG